MEPEAVPMGTSLNFRVERKIVTPGGEWGTPREIIVSLDPLEDEPGLSRNSRVRLSDDKNSVWVTLPPKLLVEIIGIRNAALIGDFLDGTLTEREVFRHFHSQVGKRHAEHHYEEMV